jgi:hypothetical protein
MSTDKIENENREVFVMGDKGGSETRPYRVKSENANREISIPRLF